MKLMIALIIALGMGLAQPNLSPPLGAIHEYTGLLWWSEYSGLSRVTRTLFGQSCIAEETIAYSVRYVGPSLRLVLKAELEAQGYRVRTWRVQRGYFYVDRLWVIEPRFVLEVIEAGQRSYVRWCRVNHPEG